MIEFSLSKALRKALPTTVTVNGSAFEVCPSFRTVLKILRMLDDPDVIEGAKGYWLKKWFFPGEAPEEWEDAFWWFVRCGDPPDPGSGEKGFDYEFDAPEIYASFMSLYGIDLFETDLHWWKFRALLNGCFRCPCALSEKIRIRNIDPEKCEDKAAARAAKDAAQLPGNISMDNRLMVDQLTDRLLKGEPVDDLLKSR